jgi:hypothetical protein
MNARFIVISRIGSQRAPQVCLAQHNDVVDALSTNCCHGEPAAMGLSRMPRADLISTPYLKPELL